MSRFLNLSEIEFPDDLGVASLNFPTQVVLMGLTGSGKSTLGNRLLDSVAEFLTSDKAALCTLHPELAYSKNLNLSLLDTPGLNVPNGWDEESIGQIRNAVRHRRYINGVLLCIMSGSRLSGSLVKLIEILPMIFSCEVWQHLFIVFTFCNKDFAEQQKITSHWQSHFQERFGQSIPASRFFHIDSIRESARDLSQQSCASILKEIRSLSPIRIPAEDPTPSWIHERITVESETPSNETALLSTRLTYLPRTVIYSFQCLMDHFIRYLRWRWL